MRMHAQSGTHRHDPSEGTGGVHLTPNRRRWHPVTAGNTFVDFPKICKHFAAHGGKGWDANTLCGPKVMGASPYQAKNEMNCCYGHPPGGQRHKNQPTVNGKPFVLSEHKDALVKAGLSGFRQELKDEADAGKPPPGTPKDISGVKIYPARHFA